MRGLLVLFLCFLLAACGKKVQSEDLPNLNGYWEIQKVVFSNGESKNYTINATIDYIEVAERTGFRKKVQPILDGGYRTSDDAEKFSILEQNDEFYIRYKNDFSEWEEKIKRVTSDELVLINADQITYIYKRFEPIKIE
jgi:hypothetical protein